MGIPKFFRWLTRRYPMILQNLQREEECPPVGKSNYPYHCPLQMESPVILEFPNVNYNFNLMYMFKLNR